MKGRGKGRSSRGSGKGGTASSRRKRKRESEVDDDRPGKEASDDAKMEGESEEEEAQVNSVNSLNCVNSDDVEIPLLPGEEEALPAQLAEETAAPAEAELACPAEVAEGAPAELAEEAAPAAEEALAEDPEGAPAAELAEPAGAEAAPAEDPEGAPPAELAEAAAPAADVAAEPARPAPGRDVGPRARSTPALLRSIKPSSLFKLRLDKNARRFQVEMDKRTQQHPSWTATERQMYYSRSFKSTGDWQAALRDVRLWMWTKANKAPLVLTAGVQSQTPGSVPEEVVQGLLSEMRELPPPRNYGKKRELG